MAELAGYVQRVVFNSGDFNVLNFFVAETDMPGMDRNTTVRGNLFGLLQVARDVPIKLMGEWKKHRKYGMQFAIQSWEPWADTPEDVTLFLHTCVDGISPDIADALSKRYGLEVFQRLTDTPQEVMGELAALDQDALEQAVLGWETALATRDLSALLKTGGLSQGEVQSALNRFGTQAGSIVRGNPFRLMEIPGMPFVKVDRLAEHLGSTSSNIQRIEGAVLWAGREAGKSGHLFLRRGQIPKAVIAPITRTKKPVAPLPLGDDPDEAFAQATAALVARDGLILEEGLGVYPPEAHTYERESAAMLAQMLSATELAVDTDSFLEEYERGNKITLSDAQRQAVEHLAENRVLVLTGLPGTGKTTIAAAVLAGLINLGTQPIALAAPTGKAAWRLQEAVTQSLDAAAVPEDHPLRSVESRTLHRLLGYQPSGDRFLHHRRNPLPARAVIVDEASMIDVFLMERLVGALSDDARLVLLGDADQLPSVDAGAVFRDLVAAGENHGPITGHVVRLGENFRARAADPAGVGSSRSHPPAFGTPRGSGKCPSRGRSSGSRYASTQAWACNWRTWK